MDICNFLTDFFKGKEFKKNTIINDRKWPLDNHDIALFCEFMEELSTWLTIEDEKKQRKKRKWRGSAEMDISSRKGANLEKSGSGKSRCRSCSHTFSRPWLLAAV